MPVLVRRRIMATVEAREIDMDEVRKSLATPTGS
jgi:hypothetical protein